MKYFKIDPAIPGELGENVVFDHRTYPPILLRLHYELDDPTDEPIFTSHPAFVVSAEAKKALLEAKFTGFQFDDVEISKSIHYIAQYGEDRHPGEFYWIKIEGEASKDDFGIHKESQDLVVSERALELLEDLGIVDCQVKPFEQ